LRLQAVLANRDFGERNWRAWPEASPSWLGLQLRSATGPVNVFVIEQVERPTPD
jgi:hypothetical protein